MLNVTIYTSPEFIDALDKAMLDCVTINTNKCKGNHKENGTANHVKNIMTARLNGSHITKKKEY